MSSTPRPTPSSSAGLNKHGHSNSSSSLSSSGSTTPPLKLTKLTTAYASSSSLVGGVKGGAPPTLVRRSSASFNHVRTNSLVSSSPFKTGGDTSSTLAARKAKAQQSPPPSQHDVARGVIRRAPGDDHPVFSQIHSRAKSDENTAPDSARRPRQSKGFLTLSKAEPVTKSPFFEANGVSPATRAAYSRSVDLTNYNLDHLAAERIPKSSTYPSVSLDKLSALEAANTPPLLAPNHSLPSRTLPGTPQRPARPVSMNVIIPTVASPATPSPRSNLVSRRLFGPRTPDTTPRGLGDSPEARQRRKTVTWDETCDVVEFDREDEMSIASVNGTDASRDSEESEQEELASPPQSIQTIPSLPDSTGMREYYGPDRDSGASPSPILSGSINELADDNDGERRSISSMITEDEMPTPQRHDIELPDEGYSHNSDDQDVISHPATTSISEMQSFLTNMNSFRDDSVSTHDDSFTKLKDEPDVETSFRLSESRSPERFPRISRDAVRRQVEQQRMEGGSDDSFEHHQSASYMRSRHSHSPSPVRPESAVVVSSPFKQSNRSDVNLEDVHSALDRLMLGVERGFEPSILSNQSELDRDDDSSSIDDGPSFAPQSYGRAPDVVESTVIIDEDQSINEEVDVPLSRESTVMTNTSTSSSSGPFTPRVSDAESPMMHTISHEDHFSNSKPLPPPPGATPPTVHVTLDDEEVTKTETLMVPAVTVRRGSTIKKREEAIKAKRREQRALEGRPSRRRSQSTGDLKAKFEEPDQLDLTHQDEPDLTDAVQSELAKRQPAKKTYMMKQRRPTIYASDSRVGHLGVAGDVHRGRAWKAVRRPSDMNEYSKQIRHIRNQQKAGAAPGKVFVKVIGIKDLDVPLPSQPTYFTCVLNNGIHFVETPACRLERESLIEQEFELIENEKLEFTLTLKIRKDPHINQMLNPPARPAYVPAARVETPTKTRSGVMSFFSSPAKRQSKIVVKEREPIPQPIESNDPFGRYLKKDLSMARAMVTFKDIVEHCDTKLFETSYPLIAQCSVGRDVVTKTVGEIVLHIFRLPPIPGVSPDDLPQSLDECTRGLRHVQWHKIIYHEGVLTQLGGDCTTWRRRSLQVMGANLIAYNDVTKKPITTMDLRKVTLVEDDGRNGVNPIIITPPADPSTENRLDKPKTLRRQRSFNALAGIEHSFRVIFDGNENDEVCFFADNAEEKARWMEIFSALVGRIPHNPLWAEILWQRQQESS
ncbi:hypothetical protein CPB86DRAFT_790005 [Serendipita vermifera]|nr:hypothetical protein CPB86DRAFT_790005 [Serendipita vermifera]